MCYWWNFQNENSYFDFNLRYFSRGVIHSKKFRTHLWKIWKKKSKNQKIKENCIKKSEKIEKKIEKKNRNRTFVFLDTLKIKSKQDFPYLALDNMFKYLTFSPHENFIHLHLHVCGFYYFYYFTFLFIR